MVVLIVAAIIQGAIESYFRISAKQAALTHGFDPRIIGNYEKNRGDKEFRQFLICRLASGIERNLSRNFRDCRCVLGQQTS
jgi:hypothetical protein